MSRTIVSADDLPKSPTLLQSRVKCAGLVLSPGRRLRRDDGHDCGRDDTGADGASPAEYRGNSESRRTTLDKAVSATVILADEMTFRHERRMGEVVPTDPPARQGAKLPVRIPKLKVSIAMIAEA